MVSQAAPELSLMGVSLILMLQLKRALNLQVGQADRSLTQIPPRPKSPSLATSTLTSSFIPIIHTLRLSSGGGGSVSGGGTFTYGDSVTITATPETNYAFSGWTGASFTGQSNSTLSFTLLADTNLTANFVKLSASSLSNAEDLGANWFSSWFGTF